LVGRKRRTEIARALVVDPKFAADEPSPAWIRMPWKYQTVVARV
jgi:hypothetical protein